MAGPFSGYSPPGVYTQTNLDTSVGGLLGNIRVPALIGVADEVKLLSDYDIVRGSSATRDNKKAGESVGPFTGSNKDFTVSNYPIVKGDGTNTITNNPNDVQVKVNGEQVLVAKVVGLTGVVTLALAPTSSDTVTITYFYKKTDTKVIDEDVSDQATGLVTTFYTHHKPIVDGSNAGKTTTSTRDVTAKVNGSIVGVSFVDGANGTITLTAAPAGTDTVTLTYYFNQYANTADDLPVPGLTRMIRCGLSPDTSDFIETIDFAIIHDQIQWGTGFSIAVNKHTTGSEFFDETQIVGQLIDDRIYNEDVSSQVTGTNYDFTVRLQIVDGTGTDTITDDPAKVIVKVGPVGSEVAVDVTRVDGENKKVWLKVAPTAGQSVLITYWFSRVVDDTYEMEVVTVGAVGVGTYKITSADSGRLGIAVPNDGARSVANPLVATDVYTTGPITTKGYTVDETVTLTFTNATSFTVTSTDVVHGSSGAGKLDSTYIDARTGLIFTLATPVAGAYAAADTLEIDVTEAATFVTSVIPITSIPGMWTFVNNTTDTSSGDITDLVTYNKSGKEPSVGDTYYITYEYTKTDFECAVYTKFKDITNEYGALSSSNPMALASYLMFLNGASVLILCQVVRATGSEVAADQSYFDVLDRLTHPVEGIKPSIIFPVTTSTGVIEAVSQHCSIQSSKRYRNECTSFFSFAVGTEPLDAANYADGIKNKRMVAVYPDGAQIELVEPDGSVNSFIVDGSFLAAALVGVNVNTAYDVATPMTRKTIVGFTALVRTMDEVTMDMVASKGVTLIELQNTTFRVRHCLTTDMSSTLTREFNVTTIADFIQVETRRVLDPFIGRKFTSTLTTEVEDTERAMLKSAVLAEIIVDSKGVTAERDSTQPDYIKVTGFYIPIFGVNWIDVTYGVRVRF